MMLLISIVLGIVPLLGIVWTLATGTIKTVDGLFISLMMLTLSGIFLLNAYWELRDKGMLAFLHRKNQTATAKGAAGKETAAKEKESTPASAGGSA